MMVARHAGMVSRTRVRAVIDRWLHPWVTLAAATFLLGGALGVGVMLAISPSAVESVASLLDAAAPYPEQLTTGTVFLNNLLAVVVLLVGGALSFGLLTALSLVFNGLLLGVVAVLGAGESGVLAVVALIAPHGVIELPALFLVGGVAYRLAWRVISYLRGVDERPPTRTELGEAAALFGVAVAGLLVAAWIESNLTLHVARAVTGGAAGG